ncbi:MAG: FAD-dependent oxidoreductase [Pseudonocardia sp.]|nr:FAD-dependent oxidoreductase [Pseudonocardia sp.]
MTRQIGDHAVVLGASLSGLCAARVLAESFAAVTVVERDTLPVAVASRRGVPQGRHLHALLPRGRRVLDSLFDGLSAELVTAGAPTGDGLGNVRWLLSGRRLRQVDIGEQGLFLSRPFLEGHVLARVRALPRVEFLDGHDVSGVTSGADRVTGVRVQDRAGGPGRVLDADLVVDCTGRGSRTPVWLAELGHPGPAEDRVRIEVAYASRLYRFRPGAMGADRLILCGWTPACPRGAAVAELEGGRHIVTLAGMLGEAPPTDPDGFVEFASRLPFPDVHELIRAGEPLDDPVAFRYPANVRRRYERLRRFPAGLLVLGDAVCSFDPIYGQGMTVAALQAEVLRAELARGRVPAPRRYFRRIARVLDAPWGIATGGDLAFPGVQGRRTPMIRLVNAYLPRLHAAAETDARLGAAFIRVTGLIARPEGLLRPDRVLRVLRGARNGAARGLGEHRERQPAR